MGRTGIYKSEVVRARDRLLASGRHPSIDAVRRELGDTGSRTTISKYLKEIEEEASAASDAQGSARRANVSEAIVELAGRLAERLNEEASAQLIEIETRHDAARRDWEERLAAAEQAIKMLKGQLEASEGGREKAEAAGAALGEALQDERMERSRLAQHVDDLQAQLKAADTHVQSLEEKFAHSRTALEHFRQAAQSQREETARGHAREVAHLQQELRSQRDRADQAQLALATAQRDAATLHSQLAARDTAARDAQAEMSGLKSALREVRAENEALRAERTKLEREAAVQAVELDRARERATRAEEREAKELQAALAAQTAILAQIGRQIVAADRTDRSDDDADHRPG